MTATTPNAESTGNDGVADFLADLLSGVGAERDPEREAAEVREWHGEMYASWAAGQDARHVGNGAEPGEWNAFRGWARGRRAVTLLGPSGYDRKVHLSHWQGCVVVRYAVLNDALDVVLHTDAYGEVVVAAESVLSVYH